MRRLSDEERVAIFGGCSAIEATVHELADRHIGTFTQQITGSVFPANGFGEKEEQNECFVEIAKYYPLQTVYGWCNEEKRYMIGVIYIQCNEEEANNIDKITKRAGGFLLQKGIAVNGLVGFFKFIIG